jgi:hypothetical protein
MHTDFWITVNYLSTMRNISREPDLYDWTESTLKQTPDLYRTGIRQQIFLLRPNRVPPCRPRDWVLKHA